MARPSYSLDELQAQYDELHSAIISGALEVKYADKTVKYQSIDAMRRALSYLGATIDGMNGQNAAANSQTIAIFHNGL